MICYIAHEEKLFRVQLYEKKSRERSTFAGNCALLPTNVIDFCNVARSEILAGKSFIVSCHVTLK